MVHGKSKHINKSVFNPPPPSFKNVPKSKSDGILPTPTGRGIIIKEGVVAGKGATGNLPPPPVYGKGQGKLIVAHPITSDESSDDEATILAPLVPLHQFELAVLEIEVADETSPRFALLLLYLSFVPVCWKHLPRD